MVAALMSGWVKSVCHPSEVGEMSTSVLGVGHSISGVAQPCFQEMIAAKLPYTRTEQNILRTTNNIVINLVYILYPTDGLDPNQHAILLFLSPIQHIHLVLS